MTRIVDCPFLFFLDTRGQLLKRTTWRHRVGQIQSTCKVWHRLLPLMSLPFTAEVAEVSFGAALLSLTCAWHISPEVQTDLCWIVKALHAAGVSPRLTEKTADVYRRDKREKNLPNVPTPGGSQLLSNDVFHVRGSSTGAQNIMWHLKANN